ncbi:MAG: hypothetical protein IKX06_01935 [Clostridia bacterium]|nr:hypothetical protein [Clostridia bacterium]
MNIYGAVTQVFLREFSAGSPKTGPKHPIIYKIIAYSSSNATVFFRFLPENAFDPLLAFPQLDPRFFHGFPGVIPGFSVPSRRKISSAKTHASLKKRVLEKTRTKKSRVPKNRRAGAKKSKLDLHLAGTNGAASA